MTRHALRNSLLPVSTIIGLSLGTLIGGAILTETIFGLSGVGKTLYDAITAATTPSFKASLWSSPSPSCSSTSSPTSCTPSSTPESG